MLLSNLQHTQGLGPDLFPWATAQNEAMQGEREREVKTSSRGREMEVCGESVTQTERLLSLPSEKKKGGGRAGEKKRQGVFVVWGGSSLTQMERLPFEDGEVGT